MKRFAVIMAGGSGTRFWPKSSKKNPKQLLALTGKLSLLQETASRIKKIVPLEYTNVVSTELLKAQIKRQLPGVGVLAEPEARNTMAAVCWSVWTIAQKHKEGSVVVLPADAHIRDVSKYQGALKNAFAVAESQDRIVCLGIAPTFPATGYGYIEAGKKLKELGSEIKRFVEKPNSEKAIELVSTGDFLWNAGIFVFSIKTFISEVRLHAPEFASVFDNAFGPKAPPLSKAKLRRLYQALPKLPLDVALMEKTTRGAVLTGSFGWNDLGSWPALEDIEHKKEKAGSINADGGSLSIDSTGNIVDVTSKKFVALIGVQDLIIVETKNAILVCAKSKAQDIKKLVEEIQKDKKLSARLL